MLVLVSLMFALFSFVYLLIFPSLNYGVDVYALSVDECRIEPIPLLVILEFLMNFFHTLENHCAQVDIVLCISWCL